MNQASHPPSEYITPKEVFIAYAKMRGTRNALPATRTHFEKRWRILAGLFGFNEDQLSWSTNGSLLEEVVTRRNHTAFYSPFDSEGEGNISKRERSLLEAHKQTLARKAAALRSEYDLIGGKLMESLLPVITGKRVFKSRLLEFGIPMQAPDPFEEMRVYEEVKHTLREIPSESKKNQDDISRDRIEALKIFEELETGRILPREVLSDEKSLEYDVDVVKTRAIERGLASKDGVNEFIFDMLVNEFLELTRDYPRLSRVHFRPYTPPPPPKRTSTLTTLFRLFIPEKSVPEPISETIPEIPEVPEELEKPHIREQLEMLKRENPHLLKKYERAQMRDLIEKIWRCGTVDTEC